MSTNNIAVVIIAKNEEKMIANCIETVQWASQVLVVDDRSTDATAMLAERAGAKVISHTGTTFASARNQALAEVSQDWILYIDADERVTPTLYAEVLQVIQNHPAAVVAYAIPRRNIHYGVWLQHGQWGKDAVVRLFHKQYLREWQGDVHEHAEVEGQVAELKEPLIHLTHRSILEGLQKSEHWTAVEARLLLEAGHKKIGMFRLVSIPVRDFFRRMIFGKAYKDGAAGWIEAMVQSMNRFLVYAQLWELQQEPSIPDTYAKYERDIAKIWQRKK